MGKNIDSLKKVVTFGLSLEKTGKDIFFGGFHAQNLGELMNVYNAALPAFAGIGDAVPELQDLDASEIEELSAMIVAGGVLGDHAGDVLMKSLAVAAAAFALFKVLKS